MSEERAKEDWNCGNNVPQVVGVPLAILAQQFDMRANPTTGVITGAVYGTNQILCGNVFSNQWLLTGFVTICVTVPELVLKNPCPTYLALIVCVRTLREDVVNDAIPLVVLPVPRT